MFSPDYRSSRFLDGFSDKFVPLLNPDPITDLVSHLPAGTRARLCSRTICALGQRDAWTCGYRNIQMLLMSALGLTSCGDQIASQFDGRLPNVERLQTFIEEAWRQGFDTDGAQHFKHCLLGKHAWIGTTEVAALLRSLDIRCRIVDCDRPLVGRAILAYVGEYFRTGSKMDAAQPKNDAKSHDDTDVEIGLLPAVYFQYNGHSVTVAGVELDTEWQPIALLIIDPNKFKQNGAPVRFTQQGLDGFQQCQMLFVDGFGWQSAEERQRSMVLQAALLSNI